MPESLSIMQQAATAARRQTIAAIALVLILGLHAAVVGHLVSRSLDHDEAEHLRAGEWIAAGKTPYLDFVENHTPFLHLLLARFAPVSLELDALRAYITSARILTAIAGTAAALCAAVVASRAASDPLASIPALAALLAPSWTYERGVIDVRSEPFTLLLFWAGVALIVRDDDRPRGQLLAGLGAGLVGVAAIWNPKWPLETLAIGIWFLWRHRSWRSLLAATVPPVIALAAVLPTIPLGALIFFGYRYPAAFYAWFRTSPLIPATFRIPRAFSYCAEWFHPAIAIAAMVLFARVIFIESRSRLLLLLGAFVAASALEIRFLYSYPRLWPQYFVMWGFALAAVYGVVLCAALRKYAALEIGVMAVVVVLFAFQAVSAIDHRVDQGHWRLKEAVLSVLRPGEGVWMKPDDSPFVAPAGSYYWYAFKDQVPFSLDYARTLEGRKWLPQLTEADLPPCRMLDAHLHGLPSGAVWVRFIDQDNLRNLPQAKGCLDDLLRANFARRVAPSTIVEVLPPPRRQ